MNTRPEDVLPDTAPAPDQAGSETAQATKKGKTLWKAGQSGNPGGRPRGVQNKVMIEARAACAAIIDDPEYRANLAKRARQGKLKPQTENLLWHYAKGVPKTEIDINQKITDTRRMDTDDLKAELADLLAKL